MATLIDLSHTIHDGMVTYPGLPPPRIADHLTYEESRSHYADGVEFHIGRIEMVANTGTYVDAPAHRWRGAADVAGLELASLADLPGVVIDATAGGPSLSASLLPDRDLAGRAVLFSTDWDMNWRTEAYFDGHPYLSAALVDRLVDAGPALVGIDSLNIDRTDDGDRPAHSRLLGAGIPIVEHLCGLREIDPARPFRFSAVPVKVAGLGTFPVRAWAVQP